MGNARPVSDNKLDQSYLETDRTTTSSQPKLTSSHLRFIELRTAVVVFTPDPHIWGHKKDMAEVGAALYAAETAFEGLAVGAYAISKSTAPLHVRFHKLKSPTSELARSSHTLNVVKGKAYIYGGDLESGSADPNMHVVTLPADVELGGLDYNRIEPKVAESRPLEKYADSPVNSTNHIPTPRAAHSSAVIGEVIYYFGGRYPSESEARPLDERGAVHAFDTLTGSWTTIRLDSTKCSNGVPQARTYASMASTEHPLPGTAEQVSIREHGTLCLHGGYDSRGDLMRDVWAFDVASRVWSQWPSVPGVGAEDIAGEGKICCTESRLYHIGDGFGKIDWIDLVNDDSNDSSGRGGLGLVSKTGKWERSQEKTMEKPQGEDAEKPSQSPLTMTDGMPVPRKGYGVLPITTGAGREYLLMLLGEDGSGSMARDIWSFQVKSQKITPAMLKDTIRSAVGKQSGEETWARAEVVQSTKDLGPVEIPSGLSHFAIDNWRDLGATGIVMWGGKNAERKNIGDGWLLLVE